MTRTRDMMLAEPGALIRRMFRDVDPWIETRGWFPPALRRTFGEFPWVPALEMTERDRTLFIKLDLRGAGTAPRASFPCLRGHHYDDNDHGS